MRDIDVYFGLGSRYSYLAFTQLERIEREYDCRFSLYPISSVELFELLGQSPFNRPAPSRQYEGEYRRRDAEDWASYYGVPYVEPRSLPNDHRLMAKACWAADGQNRMREYCHGIFRAVFVDQQNVDPAHCVAIATRLGLDVEVFEKTMHGGAVDARVTATAREAMAHGAFGVPTFLLGDRLFWGNDRLVLLERHLARERRP
jgi:2-hydroxychromene-2-carboxylate isomerase